MISTLFKNRWSQQWREFSRYLKYVFNDHAVIAFFFLFGALLFAYQQLLQTIPIIWWTQVGLLLILFLTLLLFKTPASFVKSSDAVFFLGDEAPLQRLWQHGTIYSMLINGTIQGLLIIIFWPLLMKLFDFNFFILLLITIFMIIAKMMLTYVQARQTAAFNTDHLTLINWTAVSELENQRLATIYGFFNLFIDVPGLQSTIKPHPYLERLRYLWPNYRKDGLLPIYVTTFIRKSEYLNLWVRMLIFGLLLIPFTNGYLLYGLLALLQYLFIAQILPLAGSYRRLVFDTVIPLTLSNRQKAFHSFLLPLSLIMLAIWFILIVITHNFDINQGIGMLSLVIFTFLLVFLYSDRIIANMFKRRIKHASTK